MLRNNKNYAQSRGVVMYEHLLNTGRVTAPDNYYAHMDLAIKLLEK